MVNNKTIWHIDKLKEWDKNPRSITKKDFERLKRHIQDHGQMQPLVITPEGEVLGGNMRLKAYRELNISNIWVEIINPKTEEEKLKIALVLNDRAGYYDSDLLGNLSGEYEGFNWENYAVDLKEPMTLNDFMKDIESSIEDEVPELSQSQNISKYGEIYQLGRHILMCGDATIQSDVEKLMGDTKADMVFTDPPYGVNYEGKTKDKLTIEGDENTNSFADALINYALVAKLGASFYVCCPPGDNFKDFLLPFEGECKLSSIIIWVKNNFVMGHGDYHYQHEPILYGWLKNGAHKFYGSRNQTSVWNIDRPARSKDHPTMKPVALVTKAINNSSKGGDIVLDLFLGSGTTLIACEQTERICYGMEIDPKYCDVIRKRYAKFIDKEKEWETVTPKIAGN